MTAWPLSLVVLAAGFGWTWAALAWLPGWLGLPRVPTWAAVLIAAGVCAGVAAVLLPLIHRLRLSVRNARKALDSTDDGFWVLDADGNFVEVNDGYCRTMGYSRAEIMQMKISDFEQVATQERIRAQIHRIVQRGNERFETRHRHRDGHWVDLEITVTAVDRRFLVAFLRDITERKVAEARIHQLAFFDPLTGLPSRRLLQDRLEQALAGSERSRRHGAILFVDLDNFKVINDTRGHAVGDELLMQVAQRLRGCVREVDSVSRLGGDEFVVLLESLGDSPRLAAKAALWVGEDIRAALERPFTIAEGEFFTTASIGVALFLGTQVPAGELMQCADTAMYQAKTGGRNRVVAFEVGMQESLARRALLEADLRQALPRGDLLPYFQPQVNSAGQVLGAEVLLRWKHPHRGITSSLDFIGLAEESGLLHPIGTWVLEAACSQLERWQADPEMGPLRLSVNVSAVQFGRAGFLEQLRHLCGSGRFDPGRLTLELTETLVMGQVEEANGKLQAVRSLGVCLAMDDFGVGQSSLVNLKRLPIQLIKVDQGFVRELCNSPADHAIVHTIIRLAQALDLEVMAEGVETEAQRDALLALGCHKFQGYLFGRPMPLEVFEAARRDGWLGRPQDPTEDVVALPVTPTPSKDPVTPP